MSDPLFGFEIDVSESHYVAPVLIPSEIRSLIAPVILQSRDDGIFECCGTSFCIVASTTRGQAVYVTARHVVDSLEEAHHANPFLLIPKAVTAEGVDHLVAVPIDSISIAQRPNDLALLRVDLEKAAEAIEDRSLQTGIALRPPDEGENTLALGYPHQAVTDTLRFESELRASHGIVEVIHNETQDTFRRETFPSFWVTGRYEGGMSGGPVFDEHTGVIGVVSRGMTPRDAPPYGIAISIGCLVELGVELKTDDGQVFDYSVSDLSAVGLIKLVGDGSVVLTRDESGLQLTWS